jgi:UDPglucose 6-dehydrogenase
MRIAVIGSGYVGLVAGACLAGSGNRVICADSDAEKVRRLSEGQIPIYEPGLSELVVENLGAGRLTFTTDVAAAVRESTMVFLAVGTPTGEDGSADLRHVLDVAQVIGDSLNSYKVIVCKSTVPVGTCDRVARVIRERTAVGFSVVSNPEFLKEGHAVEDFLRPDRIIVGSDDPTARDLMAELYAPFNRTSNRIQFMDVRSAEMTKYAANAMLATRISFMNEIACLCESVGADVEMVRRGIGSDPRIGGKFLFPGVVRDLVSPKTCARDQDGQGERSGAEGAAGGHGGERNPTSQPDRSLSATSTPDQGIVRGRMGVAFKPRTDDLREAPALRSSRRCWSGVRVRAR